MNQFLPPRRGGIALNEGFDMFFLNRVFSIGHTKTLLRALKYARHVACIPPRRLDSAPL